MKKGSVAEFYLNAIIVVLTSYIQPYLAAGVGGFAAYIYLHKNGKIELSIKEFIFIVILAVFMGYLTKETLIYYNIDKQLLNPLTALAGFMSPKVLDTFYALDITNLLKRFLSG